jgi:NADH-quinone oxidoreductase subunit M
MPKFATIFAIAMLSSAGLPLLNGFVGEFTILQGAFEASRAWAGFAVTGLVLGAAYLLWLYQRTMLGQVTNGKNLTIPDMNFRELATFAPLIAWAIWIGVYPKPYFEILQRPATEIVQRVRPEYFGGAPRLAQTMPPTAGTAPAAEIVQRVRPEYFGGTPRPAGVGQDSILPADFQSASGQKTVQSAGGGR